MKHPSNTDPCYKAAEIVIKRMQTPHRLLDFLIDACYWVSEYDCDRGIKPPESNYFNLLSIVKEVCQPWLKGGSDNSAPEIAVGIKRVFDYGGSEWLWDTACTVLAAYSSEIKSSTPANEVISNDMNGINMLFEIFQTIREADYQKAAA